MLMGAELVANFILNAENPGLVSHRLPFCGVQLEVLDHPFRYINRGQQSRVGLGLEVRA